MQEAEALHSRYNPLGEAERYVDSLALDRDIRFFILIEPGMGYLSASLRKKYPGSRIIALHAKALPELLPLENHSDSYWFPGNGRSLRDFLEQEIPDAEAELIKVIEWRPALALYKEAYCFLLSETVEFIKQADASARTLKHFGQRWFRNFFSNLTLLSELLYPTSFSFPVLITGAGPSLEETIPLIRKERQNILLLAVSSSVAALKAGGLEADMIVSTDGGNWALLHLYECFRGKETDLLCFAVSLNAALPSQCKKSRLLLMSDGSLWQDLILQKLGVPFLRLPQRGTVSAAALDLAFVLTEGLVFLTGVDLSHKGIQTHARPYSLDRLWEEKAGRFSPIYSQVFARSGLIQAGGSYDIYASWFSRQLAAYPKRLYSLGSNNAVFSSLETSSLETTKSGKNRPVWKPLSIIINAFSIREAILFLIEALENPKYSTKLIEELSPLIITGKNHSSPEELAEAILSLTQPFFGFHG